MKNIESLLVETVTKYGSDDPEDVFSDGFDLTDNMRKVYDMIYNEQNQSVPDILEHMSMAELEEFSAAVSEYHGWMEAHDAFFGEDPFETGRDDERSLCRAADRVRSRCFHRMF